MGDFNYLAIDYQHDHVTSGPDSAVEKCLHTTHVTEPTRVRLGQKPSILDYVFTDIENVIDKIRYSDPSGKSDHVRLEWNLLIESKTSVNRQQKLNYCKGDNDSIRLQKEFMRREKCETFDYYCVH